ncbi:MAG: flavin reductase (DIM6/NTAB) family NADH-FMN oxidoreductase RutF [Saprospiraceae bacterium]|jgi:flavin reductase (DIM6/NTAB) family NADH-FMN oxidoreductase RutF
MIIDMGALSPSKVYFTLTQTIIPRPIAWIMTENSNQSLNLAPYSYFNAVCSDPALIMVSLGIKQDGSQKDSLINILENKHCVVHIGDLASIDAMNESSRELNYGESEVSKIGLATTEFDDFTLPRLSAAPIAMGCTFYQHDVIGDSKQNILYLKVDKIYYRDDVIHFQEEPFRLKVDALKVDPLCRLGSGDYANLETTHVRKRPS